MEKIKFGKAKASNTKNCENTEKKPIVTQEDIAKLLDTCYTKSINGIPNVSESVEELANDYLKKYKTKEAACQAMIKNQIIKCTTSGFLTGFGGLITLPVTLPANVTSVLYVQMRMIACIAYMAGMELNNDSTQTFVYACLAGVAVNEIVKQAGIKFGLKFTTSLVKKIPGKVLTKINQKVGFRFLTKFGTKGIINIGKCIPVVGAVVGGGFDLVETKVIADRAYHWFMEGDFTVTKEADTEEDNIKITAEDFEDTDNKT
ncbi:MAG: EcsC family protein [Candidatus Coproplasma sp.]